MADQPVADLSAAEEAGAASAVTADQTPAAETTTVTTIPRVIFFDKLQDGVNITDQSDSLADAQQAVSFAMSRHGRSPVSYINRALRNLPQVIDGQAVTGPLLAVENKVFDFGISAIRNLTQFPSPLSIQRYSLVFAKSTTSGGATNDPLPIGIILDVKGQLVGIPLTNENTERQRSIDETHDALVYMAENGIVPTRAYNYSADVNLMALDLGEEVTAEKLALVNTLQESVLTNEQALFNTSRTLSRAKRDLAAARAGDHNVDLTELRNHGMIANATLLGHDMVFETEPLYMTLTGGDRDGEKRYLGQMLVTYNLTSPEVTIRIFNKGFYRKAFSGTVCPHPHVIYETVHTNGTDVATRPCWGGFTTLIAEALAENNHYMAMELILRFLQTVNYEDSAGKYAIRWPLSPEEIGDANAPVTE